jgi:hypothetical protein
VRINLESATIQNNSTFFVYYDSFKINNNLLVVKNKNTAKGIVHTLSEIRFGVVIPQGWSYDLPKAAKIMDNQQQHEQEQIKNQLSTIEWEFSKNISKAVDDHSSGFDSIYTYDHFIPYYRRMHNE